MLRRWADELIGSAPPIGRVDLHLADTLACLTAGLATREGRALVRLHANAPDPAVQAGTLAAVVRLTECDDIHLPSCITPSAITIPAALTGAASGTRRFEAGVAAGTAAGLRLGLAAGGPAPLAAGIWPTLLVAPLMAAVAAGVARGLDSERLVHAMALALAGTNARIGRPTGALPGRWLALAQSVARGIQAAQAAERGFTGDVSLLSGAWLAALVTPAPVEMAVFAPGAATPGLAETGFKAFACARQGMNAVLGFLSLRVEHIEQVGIAVPPINLALLTRPAADRLGTLSNLPFQIAAAALAPGLLFDADRAGQPDAALVRWAERVSVTADPALDTYLPHRWAARVAVTASGRRQEVLVADTAFDAEAPGLVDALAGKWRRMLAPGEDAAATPTLSALWSAARNDHERG